MIPKLSWAVIASLAFVVVTLASAADDPPTDWRSTLLRDHPLVGTMWSAREGRAANVEQLSAALAKGPYALLGEIHDNPDHHLLQAWEIELIAADRRWAWEVEIGRLHGASPTARPTGPGLVMEMLTPDQTLSSQRIAQAEAWVPPVNPEDFARAVEWDKSGWPPFSIYEPVIKAGIAHAHSLGPGSPARERTKAVSKVGLVSALGEAEVKRLALDQPLAPPLAAALASELKDSHCGLLPDEALPRMADVQRFRDATMANKLGPPGKHGGILIAGNGHVRRDRGVPLYLERRGVKPDEIVSVMHIEVEEGETDPAAYVPRAPDGTPAVDFIWFTPRTKRPDPCTALRDSFAKPPDQAK